MITKFDMEYNIKMCSSLNKDKTCSRKSKDSFCTLHPDLCCGMCRDCEDTCNSNRSPMKICTILF
jgi:hypothetical protein